MTDPVMLATEQITDLYLSVAYLENTVDREKLRVESIICQAVTRR